METRSGRAASTLEKARAGLKFQPTTHIHTRRAKGVFSELLGTGDRARGQGLCSRSTGKNKISHWRVLTTEKAPVDVQQENIRHHNPIGLDAEGDEVCPCIPVDEVRGGGRNTQ